MTSFDGHGHYASPVTTAEETHALSADLYALLRLIDPSSFRDEADAEARRRLEQITVRAHSIVGREDDSPAPVTAPTATLRERVRGVLTAVQSTPATAPTASRAFWVRFQREVHPAYEALAATLRSGHAVAPVLRPTNYARSLFHVASALVAVAVLALAPSRGWILGCAVVFFASAWTMETSRRFSTRANDRLMQLFGPVAHAHERHRVNSATWYATALMILAVTTRPAIAAAAVAVLGFADPAAGLIGRRYGRTRLRAGRSLEGTLTFFGVATVAAFATLSALTPMPLVARLVCALAGGLTGAIAELFSTRVDDNFSIPVSVAAGLSLAAWSLGAL